MSQDTFDIIYKILNRLEKAMDEEDFNWREIDHINLGISEKRWLSIIDMMQEEQLMDGLPIKWGARGESFISIDRPRITLKGLKYLSDNSSTAKIINAAKLLKDIIPGI